MKVLNNVLCYLEMSAKRVPDKVAFSDENGEITFGELLLQAKALGCRILKVLGEKRINTPVAVVASRSVDCIVCFMGTLYAGCFYAPVDADMPVARAKALIENLAPSLIVYREDNKEFAENVSDKNAVLLQYNHNRSKQDLEIDENRLEKVRKNVIDIDPVYVIHTSGSTGVPKGIVISHRSVIDFIEWMSEEIGFCADDVFANQAPFFFDLSVKDVYLTLKHGATDHIVPKKLFMFPALLVDFLNKKEVTSLTWATSAFNLVAASGILEKCTPKHLKKVVLGGEALFGKNLNAWRRNLPDVTYVNLYGPTEVTVDCTCYIVNKDFKDNEAVPIGKACNNKQVLLLDDNLNRVSSGEQGEICVRGTGLALGYYNDPEKTAVAFVQNPAATAYRDIIYRTGDIGVEDSDGNIVFCSRKDGQIKHMGYRIELGEIERALNGIEGIVCAVCFYDDIARRIVAVFEPVEDFCGKEKIAQRLLESIPKYMLPNVYVPVEKMPYTNGGKVDRVRLKNEYSALKNSNK